MAVMGLAPLGTMFDPGPAFYMEKLVVPAAAVGKVDPTENVERRLQQLADALNKSVEDLTIYILEKPRHRELVDRIHAAGARVALYPAGDVAGAIMAATPESGIDCMMGTGGCREGLISACAVRAMGGGFYGRIDPQLATEKAGVAQAGIDIQAWMDLDTLVASNDVFFCATGITTGLLFGGVQRTPAFETTESLLIAGSSEPNSSVRQILTAYHPRLQRDAA